MQSFLNILRWSAFCSNQNSSRYGNWKEVGLRKKFKAELRDGRQQNHITLKNTS